MSNSQPLPASSPGAPLELSILIPSYGRGPKLGRLLAGLARQTLAADRFEVIVVDDGTPEPIELNQSDFEFSLHLERQANAGPGAARNRGLEFCTAPLVLIMNDDAVPAENLLETHLAAHAEAPEKCAVLGTFHFTEEARQHPFVRILDESDLLFAFTSLKHNQLHSWQYFWTCNLSLPVSILREVGGFDAELFDKAIVEDVELGYRLEELGWQVLYREDAVCHHDHVLTPEDYLERGVRLGTYLERMYQKHKDPNLLYHSTHELVGKLYASCVDVVTQYQPVLKNLVRGLESLDEEYTGRDLPTALHEKAVKLIRELSGVTLRQGIHLERTGVDLAQAAIDGPPKGELTSVVIASFNALAKTQRCIQTLLARRERGFPIELIIVDNGSTDGSAEWLAQQQDIQFICNSENLGAPHARNQGIELARGQWIAFFDNDVYVTNQWLSRALYHGAFDPDVGAICLVANRASKHQQVPYEGDSSEAAIERAADVRAREFLHHGQDSDLFTSFGILVRRAAVEKIGGFDEAFSPWGFEDDDYSLRLRLAGYRSRVALDVFVYHDHYHDADKERRHSALLRRNWDQFANKWGTGKELPMYDYDGLGLDLSARPPLQELCVPVTLPEAFVPGESAEPRSVVVLGSGRSGTSMLAGTLASAGWDVGDDPYPGREANPKGFFETEEINGINEALLESALPATPTYGHMQRWLAEAPGDLEVEASPELQARIAELATRTQFAFKDPRFCYTLPAWRPLLGEFGVVCVFREPAVTAASILKECHDADYLDSLEMNFERAVRTWESMYRQVLERHQHEGDWLFVHYDDLLTAGGIARLEAFVGGSVEHDFPDARLKRTKCQQPVSPEAARIYSELCQLADHTPEPIAVLQDSVLPAAVSGGPELTVLVCTYQRLETLKKCLDSFCAQAARPGAFELVIVNDGATDGTREYLDGREFEVPTRIVHRENGGLSAARNSGLEVACGKLVLLINDDTIATPGLVEAHIATHRRNAGRKLAVQGTFEQPREVLKNALMRTLEESDLVFCYSRMESGQTYDWNRFWTCNVSVPTAAVREVGAFDEDFRHYGCEDTDLAFRLVASGYEVLYDERARAFHDHVLDFDDLARRARTVARAWVRFFRRHPEALDSPDWEWVRSVTCADSEHLLAEAKNEIPAIERAARELSRLDLGSFEVMGTEGLRLADDVRIQLQGLLETLNSLWWFEGLSEGLREFGLDSFQPILDSCKPFGLETKAPVRALAWPRYDRDDDLKLLQETYGEALLQTKGVCLCLRHDPERDGSLESAVARLESCLDTLLAEGAGLEVLLVDNPMEQADRARLGQAVTCSIDLAGGEDLDRAQFLRDLKAAIVNDASGFEDRLAEAGGSSLPVASSR